MNVDSSVVQKITFLSRHLIDDLSMAINVRYTIRMNFTFLIRLAGISSELTCRYFEHIFSVFYAAGG